MGDVWALFNEFNDKYFWGSLNHVRLQWSSKMTLCAGKTIYRKRGRHSTCTIRLSQPLLSQRPHSDTVNTLLHEMIHAYLHVTQGLKYRDSHGPEFRSHMTRINTLHGSKITIFHRFRREVDMYRVHVYRCDGPCVHRRPFYGVLRRAILRPPGPSDSWYERHQRECGGTFRKVAGPEDSKALKKDVATAEGDKSKGGKFGHISKNRAISNLSSTYSWNQRRGVSLPGETPVSPSSPATTFSTQTSRWSGDSPSSYTITGRNDPVASSSVSRNFRLISQSDGLTAEEGKGSVVARIKAKYSNKKQSILLSREEMQQTKRFGGKGQPLEVCALVSGRLNPSYTPVNNQNLKIHKYLRRYRQALAIPDPDPLHHGGDTSRIPTHHQPATQPSHPVILQGEEIHESLVGKIKTKYSDNRQAIFFSGKEMQQAKRFGGKGQPLEVCALVSGRLNPSYIPVNNQNLNIHKYLDRFSKALTTLNTGSVQHGEETSGTLIHHKSKTQPSKQVSFQDGRLLPNSPSLQSSNSTNTFSDTDTTCPVCGVTVSVMMYNKHLQECFGNDLDQEFGENYFHDEVVEDKPGWKDTGDNGSDGDCQDGSNKNIVRDKGNIINRGSRRGQQDIKIKSGDDRNKALDRKGGSYSKEDIRGQGTEGNRRKSEDRESRKEGNVDNQGRKTNRLLGDENFRDNEDIGDVRWAEWQITDCPNCGSKVLLAEMDFHLQFCSDEDSDEGESDESTGQTTPRKCFLDTYGTKSLSKNISNKVTPQRCLPKSHTRNTEEHAGPSTSRDGHYPPWKELVQETSWDKHLLQDSKNQANVVEGQVTCPSCLEQVDESCIQTHLDLCLDFLTQEF